MALEGAPVYGEFIRVFLSCSREESPDVMQVNLHGCCVSNDPIIRSYVLMDNSSSVVVRETSQDQRDLVEVQVNI